MNHSWLRAIRRTRYAIHGISMMVVSIAMAFAAVGVARAVWAIITAVLEKRT